MFESLCMQIKKEEQVGHPLPLSSLRSLFLLAYQLGANLRATLESQLGIKMERYFVCHLGQLGIKMEKYFLSHT